MQKNVDLRKLQWRYVVLLFLLVSFGFFWFLLVSFVRKEQEKDLFTQASKFTSFELEETLICPWLKEIYAKKGTDWLVVEAQLYNGRIAPF